MPLRSFSRIGKAIEDNGKFWYSYLYKATIPTVPSANFFVDCNQSSGTPKYNPFAGSGYAFNQLFGSGNSGIYPGPTYSSSTKHLLRWQFLDIQGTGGPPSYIYLLDYLGFYPLIDCDDIDPNAMDNTITLPRYTDGDDVQITLVATAPMTSTGTCTITYTNSQGVAGRSTSFGIIASPSIGLCATASGTGGLANNATPFVPLDGNDSGVRLIESIQFSSSCGGFICAALVKPIAQIQSYEASVPTEKMFGFENQMLPEIKDGAHLNLMLQRSGTGVSNIRSEFIFINS